MVLLRRACPASPDCHDFAVGDRHDQHGECLWFATTAAYGIVTQLWTFVQMPAIAVGAAASSMAAQISRRWDRVSRLYGMALPSALF